MPGLVLVAGLGKQHYNKNKRQVLNECWVLCGFIIIYLHGASEPFSFPSSPSNVEDAIQRMTQPLHII